MIALTAVVTLLLAIVGRLFMAWTIGAGSSGSTPFAPAVGANTSSVMRSGFIVGLLGFVGSVLQGANVSETIGRGLIQGVSLSPIAVIVGLFTAAALVAVGIFTGYPIATALRSQEQELESDSLSEEYQRGIRMDESSHCGS